MTKLRERLDDLFAAVGAAAQATGLREEFIEKDYWVTELLRSVAAPLDDARVVFKGGTSLSKAFGIIERFSEDVDILLVVTRPPSKAFGKGSIDRIIKHVCARAGEDLGITADGQSIEASETGVHRNVRYAYPASHGSSVVAPGVLLEMGRRGSGAMTSVPLRSLLADHLVGSGAVGEFEFEDLAPVQVDVLDPDRTLVEKLALLHRLGVGHPGTTDLIRRSGRHLYDVALLLRDHRVRQTIASPGHVPRLAEEADDSSREWEMQFEPRPTDGFASSPIFSEPCLETLRNGYTEARTLFLGSPPSFEECLATVHDASPLL